MRGLILHPTSQAQWQALVSEAGRLAEHPLGEELESYLVFMLMRFTSRPELAHALLAIEYLDGLEGSAGQGRERLREVGDKCLLYSGLFPEQTRKRLVPVSYFVTLGRSAYDTLSVQLPNAHAGLFGRLAEEFVTLMDVLLAMRGMGDEAAGLDALAACELWLDTGSPRARASLARVTHATPVRARATVVH